VDTTDSVAGFFTVSSPLAPNLPLTDITALVRTFNFVVTGTHPQTIPSPAIFPARVSTDSTGNIVQWDMGVYSTAFQFPYNIHITNYFNTDLGVTAVGDFFFYNTSSTSQAYNLVAGTWSISPAIAAPTNLRATVGNNVALLSWDSSAQSIDTYTLRRDDGSTITPFSLPAGITTLSDSGLQNGQLYRYTVTAVKNGSESSPSNEVFARPGQFAVSQPVLPPRYPILFLHGLFAAADTWDTTKGFLTGTLGWKFGGELLAKVALLTLSSGTVCLIRTATSSL